MRLCSFFSLCDSDVNFLTNVPARVRTPFSPRDFVTFIVKNSLQLDATKSELNKAFVKHADPFMDRVPLDRSSATVKSGRIQDGVTFYKEHFKDTKGRGAVVFSDLFGRFFGFRLTCLILY